MTIDEAIICIKDIKRLGHDIFTKVAQKDFQECLDMAIRSLEMQKKLAEYSEMHICQFDEDYDYEEIDTSEYEYEEDVYNFLIDEVKEKKNDNRRIKRKTDLLPDV